MPRHVTGFALAAIIAALRPVSGAHVNPAVTLTAAAVGQLHWREAASYVPAQVAGGIAGTLLTNLMFGLPAAEISGTVRDAPITWLGDLVATVGLLSLIFTLVATRSLNFLPGAVGAYVAGAYDFTSSTGVANPAVAIGRIFTDTFAGIAPNPPPFSSSFNSSPPPWLPSPGDLISDMPEPTQHEPRGSLLNP